MRILFVTPLFLPSLGGAAVYFDTLARALRRREPSMRVTILTRRHADAPARESRDGITVLRVLPRPAGRLAAARTALAILAWSWRLRSDIVHYHTLVSYRALAALAPLVRGRLIADMRDLAARNEGARVDAYRRADRIVCASENIVEYLLAQGVPSERLAPMPVPLAALPVPSAADIAATRARYGLGDVSYVLFCGDVVPRKGVPELLAAMPGVWRDAPHLHLVLAGPRTAGADPGFERHLAGALAGDARVRALGAVPRPDVPALLRGADVFVLPSRSEGLPRAGLEALALGVRAVLPPGVPEFARACPDAVLPAITADAIATAILRARSARAPRYPIERHDADAVAERMVALYDDVLTGRSPARRR